MKVFAANWKLFKTPNETREFFSKFVEPASKIVSGSSETEIVFFPPAVNLEATSQAVKGFKIQFGAQNSYFEAEGAFTGETSARKKLNSPPRPDRATDDRPVVPPV